MGQTLKREDQNQRLHSCQGVQCEVEGKMALTLQQNPPQAIACAVQFDDQHCGIYAGDWDSYKDFAEVFDPLIQVESVV